MRDLGVIKWFRTEIDYGFIMRFDGDDLFVHRKNVLCSPSLLNTGELVLFDIHHNKGKDSASNVTLLKLENDVSVVKKWADSPESHIWKRAFPHYLEKLPRREAVDYILNKLQLASSSNEYDFLIDLLTDEEFLLHFDMVKSLASSSTLTKRYASLLSRNGEAPLPEEYHLTIMNELRKNPYLFNPWHVLPLSLYKERADLRAAIADLYKGSILIELLKTYDARNLQWINELVESIKHPLGVINWDTVPEEVLLDERINALAPAEKKIVKLFHSSFSQENVQTAAKWLYSLKYYSDKQQFVRKLPESYRKCKPFLSYLDAKEQVDVLWDDFRLSPITTWPLFSNKAKTMAIARLLKENAIPKQLNELGKLENEPQIKALLLLVWAKEQPEEKKLKAFTTAHRLIQDDLLRQAVSSSKKLNIWCALPGCSYTMYSRVPYCEGRQRQSKDEDGNTYHYTFCPRVGSCEYDMTESEYVGAHTMAVVNLAWSQWTLLEILDACEVTPNLKELENPQQYVNRLSGWVNRLEEIRERLKCSKCSQMMVNNFRYSRDIARYSSTIVSCMKGHPHDQEVYLNHCWCCQKIIDSRESKARVEGLYLCYHCGAGPWNSKKYKVGDICPREDKDEKHHRPMMYEGSGQYRCLTCDHVIQKKH
ncbi:cold shock domain-containing protein [Neobacillus cucumis]|uniref:CSD domain-containing protein n=1 Tax=Neobacillus cucumis TaxID=1740721 RepID=A0A2N5H9X5_9BACI|nr:cold shock domain-containing protein [Neobacillus cucumis]PLS02321.1 hypothetical protein CVD27_20280 [Neobacillus cucumis]